MELTTCESNQLVEATKLWFARSGGIVSIKIKQIKLHHNHDETSSIKPSEFDKW